MAIISNPRVCFSYAAYAKKIIAALRSLDLPVEEGLSDVEFSALESSLNFSFPPDLRSILREGLPVAPGFPNWRSASPQQLEVQINLPILGLCKEVSRGRFWLHRWGSRPDDERQAVISAKEFLKSVPVLVPIFRQFYIPASPQSAGNPVFYVHGVEVEVWSFDLAGFFQRIEFRRRDERIMTRDLNDKAPAWAATRARRIEFWTEMAAEVEKSKAESGAGKVGLEECMGEVARRLAEGGWGEEDVREMMDGCDREKITDGEIISDWEGVTCHLRLLSRRLLRGGWCTKDVVDSLGFSDEDDCYRSSFSLERTVKE
ncbi:unnamed protein product [Cuscuta campestris]|uniref:Knr4/Smi1-like domain-containing protein n=1 Tax=Cuscuta campestris TaxID=132261 RepID=A0A484K6F3_9ASTE|nr:unnamed protein product [Cuscuta campestris]